MFWINVSSNINCIELQTFKMLMQEIVSEAKVYSNDIMTLIMNSSRNNEEACDVDDR